MATATADGLNLPDLELPEPPEESQYGRVDNALCTPESRCAGGDRD